MLHSIHAQQDSSAFLPFFFLVVSGAEGDCICYKSKWNMRYTCDKWNDCKKGTNLQGGYYHISIVRPFSSSDSLQTPSSEHGQTSSRLEEELIFTVYLLTGDLLPKERFAYISPSCLCNFEEFVDAHFADGSKSSSFKFIIFFKSSSHNCYSSAQSNGLHSEAWYWDFVSSKETSLDNLFSVGIYSVPHHCGINLATSNR